jgi:hypothetical protein
LGITEYEAKRYESKIKGGNVLISVHTENSGTALGRKRSSKPAEAEDISSSSEARVLVQGPASRLGIVAPPAVPGLRLLHVFQGCNSAAA